MLKKGKGQRCFSNVGGKKNSIVVVRGHVEGMTMMTELSKARKKSSCLVLIRGKEDDSQRKRDRGVGSTQ